MGIVKSLFLCAILGLAIYIGNFIAKKYINRVKELTSLKLSLNVLENKIKFTRKSVKRNI